MYEGFEEDNLSLSMANENRNSLNKSVYCKRKSNSHLPGFKNLEGVVV